MTIFDNIFALAHKLAHAIVKGKPLTALEESTVLSEQAKKRVYENLSEDSISEQLNYLREIDAAEDWENLVPYLAPHKSKRKPKVFSIAASLLLLVFVGYWFWIVKGSPSQGVDLPLTQIEAGTPKATLTLNSGVEVALEKGSFYQTDNVKSNGDRLIYQADLPSMTAREYNYLTVPRGGEYTLILSDSTLVYLNSASKLKYPVAFKKGEDREVELLYGEAYFEVSPSSKHEGAKFRVESPLQRIEVLGTTFNLKAYEEEDCTYTTLVEGKVHVSVEDERTVLRPGEQSILTRDTKHIHVMTKDPEEAISWINGLFIFKDKPLKEIMKVLSRWYDVDVVFESAEVENIKFNGSLNKAQNLRAILNGILNTNFIHAYEINNYTVTIQ